MWENIEYISEIIKESLNKTDVLNKLNLKNNGGNFNTLSSFIRENNLDISHFIKHPKNKGSFKIKKETNDILNNLIPYRSTSSLKKRLYKEGLKSPICELCQQGEEWMGKKMSLILDHINGDRFDNRLENLRIVCPNCNATLETHCRGMNWEIKTTEKPRKRHDNCKCGGIKQIKSKVCIKCKSKKTKKDNLLDAMYKRRLVERPPYTQLINEVNELGYTGTGRKYGVSDNSIRKWIKYYEKCK